MKNNVPKTTLAGGLWQLSHFKDLTNHTIVWHSYKKYTAPRKMRKRNYCILIVPTSDLIGCEEVSQRLSSAHLMA